MFRRQLRYNARTCVDRGQRVLVNLQADRTLARTSAEFHRTQNALKTRLSNFEQARDEARIAVAVQADASRLLVDRVREFALMLLSVTRNRTRHDVFLRYFPRGYGEVLREKPVPLSRKVGMILDKLKSEEDPWICSFGQRLAEAQQAFLIAQERMTTAEVARASTFSVLQAERISWVAGLTAARLKAQVSYLGDPEYVRYLFESVRPKKRRRSAKLRAAKPEQATPEPAPLPTPAPASVPEESLDRAAAAQSGQKSTEGWRPTPSSPVAPVRPYRLWAVAPSPDLALGPGP